MTVRELPRQYKTLINPETKEDLLDALRFVKNSIIGNPTRKNRYLQEGIAPKLVELLQHYRSDPRMMAEIAPIVGSLAQYNVNMLVQAGVLGPLFDSLLSPDHKVVESSAKALRSIVQHPSILHENPLADSYIHNLVGLSKVPLKIEKPKITIAEVCISILARLADIAHVREVLCQNGGVSILTEWLNEQWVGFPRVQESALDYLSGLCKGSPAVASAVSQHKVQSGKTVTMVLFQLLHDKRSLMKLGACICLVNLYNSGALLSDYESMISLQLLPCLIRLFDDNSPISLQLGMSSTSIQERAIAQFAVLIQEHSNLQLRAMEADAISKLARLLLVLTPTEGTDLQAIPDSPANPELFCKSTLLAVASIASLTEECRKQVIELKLLPCIVACLGNSNVDIRAAACKCARSLSRSVKQLRTNLVDAGIALPIFKLLFDSDVQVQITASATLCNIVLDFSPMKKIVIENGGVQQLVQLVRSTNQELRLNAAWALKNMLFQTDLETKKSVMEHLGWDTLCSVLNDPDINIQVQALNLWRNLACAKDIDFVFAGLGKDVILNMLEDKLNMKAHIPIVIQHHENAQIRVGAVWCIINLTWPEEPGALERIAELKSLHVDMILERMIESDMNMDVRDRSKTALGNITGQRLSDNPGELSAANQVAAAVAVARSSRERSWGMVDV